MAQPIGSLSTYREGAQQSLTVNVNSGAKVASTAFGTETYAIRISAPGIVTATAGIRFKVDNVVSAAGTLQFGTNPTAGDTVTLGATTYRFESTMALANDVKLEATAAATLQHLVKTINGTGVSGTDFFAGTTTPNASASAVISGTTMVATALSSGSSGNTIASTQSITGGADTWGATTLTGGSPAVATTSPLLPLNWIEYIVVTPGQKIEVISNDNTYAGTLSLTELS